MDKFPPPEQVPANGENDSLSNLEDHINNSPRLDLPDQTFTDDKNRVITIRSHDNGNSHLIRAYDRDENPDLPANASLSRSIGQCNLTEKTEKYDNQITGNPENHTDRVRLNDITVADDYQNSGTGGRMLESAEEIAQKTGAREIYGVFTPEAGKEAELREFYQKHGFSFRTTADGEEVYKTFFFK